MATPKNGLTEEALHQAAFTTGMPYNTSSTDSGPPYPPSLTADQRVSKEEALLLAKDMRLQGNTLKKIPRTFQTNDQTKTPW